MIDLLIYLAFVVVPVLGLVLIEWFRDWLYRRHEIDISLGHGIGPGDH